MGSILYFKPYDQDRPLFFFGSWVKLTPFFAPVGRFSMPSDQESPLQLMDVGKKQCRNG